MLIREEYEETEEKSLCEYAVLSKNTKGRKKEEEKCPIRTEFQRDRDRITHCKSFRRLMHKTQVFIAPEGDHYRTRLTHTLEVAQISRTIARALHLNEDLTEAIALGHDLGHTPFGHTGEDALKNLLPEGFKHNEQSVRVVERIEKGGTGLNLTYEVIDGIREHRTRGNPSTLEGKIVQVSDKIAYINHDIDDAIRASILSESDLPGKCTDILGHSGKERINYLILSIVKESSGKNCIKMEDTAFDAMRGLRKFLFETVYQNQLQTIERDKIGRMFEVLMEYYCRKPDKLPEEFVNMYTKEMGYKNAAANYIACMTDRFAMKQYQKVVMPLSWSEV